MRLFVLSGSRSFLSRQDIAGDDQDAELADGELVHRLDDVLEEGTSVPERNEGLANGREAWSPTRITARMADEDALLTAGLPADFTQGVHRRAERTDTSVTRVEDDDNVLPVARLRAAALRLSGATGGNDDFENSIAIAF